MGNLKNAIGPVKLIHNIKINIILADNLKVNDGAALAAPLVY